MNKNITSLHKSEKRHLVAGDLFGDNNSLLFTFEGDETNSTYNTYISSVDGNKVFSASASPLIPLSADYYLENKINLYPVLFQANDGHILIHNPIFDGVKDISINKDTIFYLTTSTTMDSFLTDNSKTVAVGGFTSILSVSGAAAGNYISAVAGDIMYVNSPSETNSTIFRIVELGSDIVSIVRGEKYITIDSTSPYSITLDEILPNNDEFNQQNFTMLSSGNNVYFRSNVDGLTGRYIGYDGASLVTSVTTPQFFNLGDYNGDMVVDGLQETNNFVHYYNELTSPLYSNTVDIVQSLSGVKRNYLVASPFKTKINTTVVSSTTALTAAGSQIPIGNIGVELLGLKNMYSVEYETTYVPEISNSSITFVNSADNLMVREYDKIFTGTNQELGYENVFLGYTTDFGKVINFASDKVTYFHYPKTAPRAPLSAIGLEYIGAIGGSSPFRSDKIWKKMANYGKDIWWGDSQQWQTGVFLCAWLSGSPDPTVKPVWKERWYNPGYATITQAATGGATYINNDPIIWDEDAIMTFDPGVYYKYFHLGTNNNFSIVNTLTGDGTALRLHLDNWSLSTIDLSPYRNNGDIINYDASMIIDGPGNDSNAIKFNGVNQHVIVKYDSSLNINADMSIASWVNATDWTNVSGNHIISNSLSGGWDMAYNRTTDRIESTINFGTSALDSTVTVGYPVSALLNNKWHHLVTTYNSTSGSMNLYVDNVLRDTSPVTAGSVIYYVSDVPIYVGANAGRFESLDEEQNTEIYHFNGKVDDVRIYDWAINISDIKHIYLTKQNFDDISWSVPTGTQSLIEEVERFFKNKLPGMKSQYYNIRLVGLQITDPETRETIENIIRDTVSKLSPAYTELYQIIWD